MTHLQVECSGTNPHTCVLTWPRKGSLPPASYSQLLGTHLFKHPLKLSSKGNISVSGPKFLSPVPLLQTHHDKLDIQPVQG